ncbi:MAG: hypothetical protein EOO40_04590 [Deltaproteobacteria bacterium]|nr:MAG: hypothetical protein EOO40_04590 [Deltaproteobacteria bacterium]
MRRLKHLLAVISLVIGSGASAAAATLDAPELASELTWRGENTPTGGNVFLVELRVNFGERWYRLASGPRPENEAKDLFINLHRHLVPFKHIVSLYDMDRNVMADEIKYEGRQEDGSST